MKFLLDANVEFRLATFLTSLHHDVKTIAHDYPHSLPDEGAIDEVATKINPRHMLRRLYKHKPLLDEGFPLVPPFPYSSFLCLYFTT